MRRRSTRLVSPPVEALRQIEAWPAEHAAAGVATADAVIAHHGAADYRLGWGSVTKLLVAVTPGALDTLVTDEVAPLLMLPIGLALRHSA